MEVLINLYNPTLLKHVRYSRMTSYNHVFKYISRLDDSEYKIRMICLKTPNGNQTAVSMNERKGQTMQITKHDAPNVPGVERSS